LRSKTSIVFLPFSTLYLFLSTIFLINMAQLGYHSPLKNAEYATIRLTLISSSYDALLLYISCSIMIILATLTKGWRLNKKTFLLMLTSASISALTFHVGAQVTSQFFIVLAGFVSLILTTKFLHAEGSIKLAKNLKYQAVALLSIWITIELLSIIVWLLTPFNPQFRNSWQWGIIQFETQLFHTPEFLVTPIFLATAFSWTLLLFKRKLRKIKNVKLKFATNTEAGQIPIYRRTVLENHLPDKPSKPEIKLLIASLTLTLLFVYYPYLPNLIPQGYYVGVDVPYYVSWLKGMDAQNGWLQIVSHTFKTQVDRPLNLLFMYNIWKLSGSPILEAVKFTPLVLGPLLMVSVYFFTSKLKSNHSGGGVAALFTSFSYTLTVGVICAFFANWLALSLVYIFSTFLVMSMNKPSIKLVLATLVTSAALLFTHAFTWAMFMGIVAVTLLFTAFKSLKKKTPSKEFKVLSATLTFNVIIDLLKRQLIPTASSSIGQTVSLAQNTFSIQNLLNFWSLAYRDLTGAMLGFFINPPMLILALIGALNIVLGEDNNINRYLLATLIASSLAFILGEWLIHIRILYNLPLFIFATIGLEKTFLSQKNEKKSGFPQKIKNLSAILLILISINYSLRCGFTASQQIRSPA